MNKLIYLFSITLLFACDNDTIKKPKNFIEKDKMINLIVDMKIAQKAKNVQNKYKKKNQNYMTTVYEKYQVDSTQFKENNDYYTEKLEIYQEIYTEAQKRLKDSVKKYEDLKVLNDSVKKEKKNLKLKPKLDKKDLKNLNKQKKKKQVSKKQKH